MFYPNVTKEEVEKLKEYENPSKWEDWRELTKKQRFILQRMIVDKDGAKDIILAIAKDATKNLENSTERMTERLFNG